MLPKLSYTQKNKLLLPLGLLGLVLCWFLAFSKTFDAIQLNRKLSNDAVEESDMSFNPAYLQRKQDALDKILKAYQVTEHWKDELWMKGSAIAAKQNVGVDYTIAKAIDADSTTVGRVQSLYFYGNYKQLVRLIDTLERLPRIGKVSALQVKAPKSDLLGERVGKSVLRIDFKGMEQESTGSNIKD